MPTKSSIKILLTLSIFQAGLLACREGSNPHKGALVIANSAEPSSLDLHAVTGQPELRILGALYEGLVIRGLKDEAVRPGLARNWETSSDGKTYTFHLRPSKWSNGKPLVSLDFVRSWRRLVSPQTASEYASLLNVIRNGVAIQEKRLPPDSLGVHAPNDSTLVVDLENPVGFFLFLCAFEPLAPLPIDTIEKHKESWTSPEHMVSNGPFLLKEWKRNVELRLIRNPNYWDVGQVKQEEILFKPVEDQLTAFNMFLGKEVAWIFNVPPSKLDIARKMPEYFTSPMFGTYYFIVNCRQPDFASKELRLALSYAIDREKLVKRVLKSIPTPATGLVPPTPGYAGPQLNLFDPAKAKEYLQKSGFSASNPPKGLQILFNTAETHKDIAEVIRQMWKETLGLDAELVNYEWKVYLDNTKNLNYPSLARASWIGDFPDPVSFLDMHTSTNGNNRTGYSSQGYDKVIAESWKIADPEARRAKLLEAEKLLMEDMPVIPIYFYALTELRNPKLKNALPNPLGMYSWKDIYLEP